VREGGGAELTHPHVMEIQYFHIYFYTYTQLSITCSGRTVRHNIMLLFMEIKEALRRESMTYTV